MADIADQAGDLMDEEESRRVAMIRKKSERMEKGYAGECEYCGYEFSRLVNGACGRCRDEYKL